MALMTSRTLGIAARATAIAAGLALAAGAASAEKAMHKNPEVGGAPMYANKNIIQNAVNSKDHTTLVAAVKAAGLVKTLEGKGPFTVFAPTNEAFDKLPQGTVKTLLEPANKAMLQKILECHVVAGKDTTAKLKSMIKKHDGKAELKTVGGCMLTATMSDGHYMITDENGTTGKITIPNVMQSNGVIQVVDTVMLPAKK